VTRYLHALACLYALTACGLIRCAYVSSIHGNALHTAFFAGAAVLLATAIAHHAYQRDELCDTRVRLERATRPHATHSAEDGAVAVALAAACCERWWTSAGAEHEPTTCTRKDSTT
jgi:hypothetical protein